MANVIGLSEYHEKNLRKLAAYLLSGELMAEFHMDAYDDWEEDQSERINCGSIGCAVGHAPFAGIHKHTNEDWYEYNVRVFGLGDFNTKLSDAWDWCFNSCWVESDNTAKGAGHRIIHLLEKGTLKAGENR